MSGEAKAVLIRYIRVFLATFIATFSVEEFILTSDASVQEMILKASIAAAIAAVFKLFRETDNTIAKKIPL